MEEREDEDVPMWIQALEAELKYKATRRRFFYECLWGLLYGFCFFWIFGEAYAVCLLISWVQG